ncbi:MAG: hypothetical protein N5P05_001801 [Chroococcopsis gigantea SAG 12.99]|jgi:hypothetical protein|nr:hypothetical protein [Chroococcopsis gigantea SAG 12.99]
MKFSKIDLSSVVAANHDENGLVLLIDRGGELEYLEIPAPFAAYEGLKELNTVVQSPEGSLEVLPPAPDIAQVESFKAEASWEYNPSEKLAKLSCSFEVTYKIDGEDCYFDDEDYYFDYDD